MKQKSANAKDRKGRKQGLMETVRRCMEEYKDVYVVRFENVRGAAIQQFRACLKETRLLFGKHKVLSIALANCIVDENKNRIGAICEAIKGGDSGLLFSNEDPDDIRQYCIVSGVSDYARPGFVVSEDVVIPPGRLTTGEVEVSHIFESVLKRNGVPVILDGRCLRLEDEYAVCRAGERLGKEAAAILKILSIRLAAFRVNLVI